MIRPFDWRDFPNLHRNRNDGLWLDSSLALTRWMALVPAGALLSTIAPATGIFTYIATNEENGGRQVVGQFIHAMGNPNAKLTFITPEEAIESPEVPRLLDYLAARAGDRGAHNMLAEVNDRSEVFEVLRRAGYGIYTRQRVWELKAAKSPESRLWRPAEEKDEHHVHYLYHSLVPALVQQTEPPPWEKVNGLLFFSGDEVMAYVHLRYGPKGILAQPFFHPDTDRVEELLASLFNSIQNPRGRPVYLCVRSHQFWLTTFLDEMDLRSGQSQAVMVKRLVVLIKEPALQPASAALENVRPEISTHVNKNYDQKTNYR